MYYILYKHIKNIDYSKHTHTHIYNTKACNYLHIYIYIYIYIYIILFFVSTLLFKNEFVSFVRFFFPPQEFKEKHLN